MNTASGFAVAAVAACAALLAGCAAPPPSGSGVIRARPPVSYENTITNYFDLSIRGPQPNRVLTIGKPEPGGCPVGGHVSSGLGWVVPVQYATRTGSLTGANPGIDIKGKQYYFWFRQDTLYGVTPKLEVCP